MLGVVALEAQDEVLVVAPYLIPQQQGLDDFAALVEQGARVRILTNSLTTNDSTPAQSAYGRYRRRMLNAGVELYELRADARDDHISDTPPVDAEILALHSKLIVIDRRLSFVGSLNLDPRSIYLNSETGILIDDPELAERIAQIIERDMLPENAWHVRFGDYGRIIWESSAGTRELPPARNDLQRLQEAFMGVLPIEDQL